MKKFISEYLNFTKKERTGIIVVSVLIVLFTILPFLYPFFISQKKYDHNEFEKEISQLKMKQIDSADERPMYSNKHFSYVPYKNNEAKTVIAGLFYFDPNTLNADGWKKLGIRDKTIATIQNYLAKGGRFRKAEDIGKIWGLHKDEVDRLIPYVRIADGDNALKNESKHFEKKDHEIKPFDINLADSAAFIALPGIGNKLAARIITFRDKLGGFYKVEQVGETWGLPDSVFQKVREKFIVNAGAIKQININTASLEELKQHPYIRYVLANAIVQFRQQHGKFNSVADIKQIQIISSEIFDKLAPYLSVK